MKRTLFAALCVVAAICAVAAISAAQAQVICNTWGNQTQCSGQLSPPSMNTTYVNPDVMGQAAQGIANAQAMQNGPTQTEILRQQAETQRLQNELLRQQIEQQRQQLEQLRQQREAFQRQQLARPTDEDRTPQGPSSLSDQYDRCVQFLGASQCTELKQRLDAAHLQSGQQQPTQARTPPNLPGHCVIENGRFVGSGC